MLTPHSKSNNNNSNSWNKNWGHRNDYKLKWQILGTQIRRRRRSEWKPLIKKDISITAIKSLDRQESVQHRAATVANRKVREGEGTGDGVVKRIRRCRIQFVCASTSTRLNASWSAVEWIGVAYGRVCYYFNCYCLYSLDAELLLLFVLCAERRRTRERRRNQNICHQIFSSACDIWIFMSHNISLT